MTLGACHTPGVGHPLGLFVYGTLKQGGSNFWRIEKLVTAALRGWSLSGQLYNVGRYPGLILPGGRRVRGEVLISDQPDEMLRVTDQLEGDEYHRILAQVENGEGAAQYAWVYVYARDISRLERLDVDEWLEAGPSQP